MTQRSSGGITTGGCVGSPRHLQSWLPWESDPWGSGLREQRSPVWMSADWAWRQWRLRCLRATLTGILDFFSNSNAVPHTWFPVGTSLRLFQSGSQSHCWDFSLPCSFSASSPLPPCHNKVSEPVATGYPRRLVHSPLLVAYWGYLDPTEWEISPLRSFLPLCFQDQSQESAKGFCSPSWYSLELPSLPVLCLPTGHRLMS